MITKQLEILMKLEAKSDSKPFASEGGAKRCNYTASKRAIGPARTERSPAQPCRREKTKRRKAILHQHQADRSLTAPAIRRSLCAQ